MEYIGTLFPSTIDQHLSSSGHQSNCYLLHPLMAFCEHFSCLVCYPGLWALLLLLPG